MRIFDSEIFKASSRLNISKSMSMKTGRKKKEAGLSSNSLEDLVDFYDDLNMRHD